jgi:crotonobetainyl-CoA:carnitine CoA-transferase CaiB-like acyl-CoA transferase
VAQRGIHLVGNAGTDRTTVARLVAERLGWPLRELGPGALRDLAAAPRSVVSVGDGASLTADDRRLLARTGWVVLLAARGEPEGAGRALHALADWTVHTDRLAPAEIAGEVVRALGFLERPAGPDAASRAAARPPGDAAPARRPLAGVRVLELTNVLAGPFCAYQLALLGAEVVKIELPLRGDLARQLGADEALNEARMGASFLAQNAGKKSVAIDLSTGEGRRAFLRLVETADVVLENFRPGVMDRLRLGYEELRRVNPRLVYCAISGFGQQGPMSGAPAYDQIVQGLSGMMSVSGGAETAPLRVGYPVADTIGGMTAAFAIASALVRRLREGEGAFIDVSMLDATIVTMGWILSNWLIAGQAPVPMGNDNFTAAPSGTFRTGGGLLNVAANKQEQFEALARLLGREDLIADPRFATSSVRKRHRAELTAELERALRRRTAAEWEPLLSAEGIPAGRVLSVPEALALPQIEFRRLLKTFDRVAFVDRPVTVALAGFKIAGADPDVSAPPPALGEHTDEILRQAGFGEEELAELRRQGAI